MKGIVPSLWFDGQAEQAAQFYTSIFPDSRITGLSRFGDAGPGPEGTAIAVDFELRGQPLNAISGGPEFKFTEAISLRVDCANQAEVDEFWEKLGAGGEFGPCGWLKDRYGLSCSRRPPRAAEGRADRGVLRPISQRLNNSYPGSPTAVPISHSTDRCLTVSASVADPSRWA